MIIHTELLCTTGTAREIYIKTDHKTRLHQKYHNKKTLTKTKQDYIGMSIVDMPPIGNLATS